MFVLDGAHYEDSGCEVSTRCQDCPLPQCRYDMPRSELFIKKYRRNQKWDRIMASLRQGQSITVVANRFNVSERQVFRIRRAYVSERTLATPASRS